MPLEEDRPDASKDRFAPACAVGDATGARQATRPVRRVTTGRGTCLTNAEQRALRGCALPRRVHARCPAEALLGDDRPDAVRGLVDQSLLSIAETPAGGGGYRMLETVASSAGCGSADAVERPPRATSAPLVRPATRATMVARLRTG